MRMLNTPQEIAVAINMHQMPVVRLDLADADEYGIKSQKVLIDNGKFKRLKPTDPDMPYLVRAEIRAFVDKKKFTLASHGCCLSNTFAYYDMEELLDYANAPIIKRDSDVVLAIVDSRRKIAYPLKRKASENGVCRHTIFFCFCLIVLPAKPLNFYRF